MQPEAGSPTRRRTAELRVVRSLRGYMFLISSVQDGPENPCPEQAYLANRVTTAATRQAKARLCRFWSLALVVGCPRIRPSGRPLDAARRGAGTRLGERRLDARHLPGIHLDIGGDGFAGEVGLLRFVSRASASSLSLSSGINRTVIVVFFGIAAPKSGCGQVTVQPHTTEPGRPGR